jgi:SulP family sulfate permease
MKQYFNLLTSRKVNYRTEILAGLTVAMTMIPESLSFAILAGFPPLVGLLAFIMGLVTAIFGTWNGIWRSRAVIVLIALKWLRVCICSCSFSRSNSNFDWFI